MTILILAVGALLGAVAVRLFDAKKPSPPRQRFAPGDLVWVYYKGDAYATKEADRSDRSIPASVIDYSNGHYVVEYSPGGRPTWFTDAEAAAQLGERSYTPPAPAAASSAETPASSP